MKKGYTKFVPLIFAIVDTFLLVVSFFIANYFEFQGKFPNLFYYSFLIIVCVVTWILISLKHNLYEIPRVFYIDKIVSKNVLVLFLYNILIAGVIFYVTSYKFSRAYLILSLLIFSIFIILWRILAFSRVYAYRKRGYNSKRIVLVGLNRNMSKLINRIYLNPKYAFNILGLFTDAKVNKKFSHLYKGSLSEIHSFLENNKPEEIIISLPHQQSELINSLFQYADNNMIRVKIIPEFSEYLSQKFKIDYVNSIPILKMRDEPLKSFTNRLIKRIFDVVFSFLVIVFIFSWLFPVITLIIKLTSKGPIFFRQLRTGKDGKSFSCYKFRSMRVNEVSDHLQATKGDSRITPFGAFMRKTSIDELPQFFNVLFNHMSIVGPRPHMLKHTEEYRVLVDKFMVRHFAKPGITGWAQVNGLRGETKSIKDMEKRANADIWYIENWNFFLDISIVLITAWSMFFKQDENAF